MTLAVTTRRILGIALSGVVLLGCVETASAQYRPRAGYNPAPRAYYGRPYKRYRGNNGAAAAAALLGAAALGAVIIGSQQNQQPQYYARPQPYPAYGYGAPVYEEPVYVRPRHYHAPVATPRIDPASPYAMVPYRPRPAPQYYYGY